VHERQASRTQRRHADDRYELIERTHGNHCKDAQSQQMEQRERFRRAGSRPAQCGAERCKRRSEKRKSDGGRGGLHNSFSGSFDAAGTMLRMYDEAPRIVIWEMTRACALACRHCRAEAVPFRNPAELSTSEAFALVDEIVKCGDPIFVLTGGDPLMRDDIYKIVEYATNKGLRVAVSPSATGRLRPERLAALSRAGCKRISLSIDAATEEEHDRFRGVKGSFNRTIAGARAARAAGLEVQINTTIARYNHQTIWDLVPTLETLDIALWSLFFVVPTGRAQIKDVLSDEQTENAFRRLYEVSRFTPFPVKTTEAPHYRRYMVQRQAQMPPRSRTDEMPWMMFPAVRDGKGFVFISHLGDIMPSGFLPYVLGNVRKDELLAT
jgi:MoaA/NifB/PqqE/SkfB family radical SAM enzyme